MSLSIGIVGLPNVGKSTLFNALTKKSVPAENYPFCTIDPSVGIVPVPDPRIQKLSVFSESEKTIPAVVEFVDIAGLVKGASEGEGLGNKFLQNIREVDAILEVVRIFEDDHVIHVHGKVDPLSDIEVINLELVMADVQTIEKRLDSLSRDVKRGDKEAVQIQGALLKVHEVLKSGTLAQKTELLPEELVHVKNLQLLTMKPILYALNKKAGGKNLDEMGDSRFADLVQYMKDTNSNYVVVDAGIEHELMDMEGEEKKTMKAELGVKSDGIDELISSAYAKLGLISYFTTGKDETRAWTIKEGSTAPVAAGVIHTDFEKGFIRAEVIPWDTLLDAGSYGNAREKGLIRTEGKEYIVSDGDVMEFKV